MEADPSEWMTELWNEADERSVRVTVDEMFDYFVEKGQVKQGRTARILRAKRKKDQNGRDLSMETWESESEEILPAWIIESFVGFKNRKLMEGDVFFIKDGSKLNRKYKPIRRNGAAREHLLCSWDRSKEQARGEIFKEFSKLSALNVTKDGKRIQNILNKINKADFSNPEE